MIFSSNKVQRLSRRTGVIMDYTGSLAFGEDMVGVPFLY